MWDEDGWEALLARKLLIYLLSDQDVLNLLVFGNFIIRARKIKRTK